MNEFRCTKAAALQHLMKVTQTQTMLTVEALRLN